MRFSRLSTHPHTHLHSDGGTPRWQGVCLRVINIFIMLHNTLCCPSCNISTVCAVSGCACVCEILIRTLQPRIPDRAHSHRCSHAHTHFQACSRHSPSQRHLKLQHILKFISVVYEFAQFRAILFVRSNLYAACPVCVAISAQCSFMRRANNHQHKLLGMCARLIE